MKAIRGWIIDLLYGLYLLAGGEDYEALYDDQCEWDDMWTWAAMPPLSPLDGTNNHTMKGIDEAITTGKVQNEG